MKILLQNTRTLLYVRSTDSWTRSEFEARDFQHSQKAIDFAHAHKLQEIQIAVKFVDPAYDVVAPVPPVAQAQIAAQVSIAA